MLSFKESNGVHTIGLRRVAIGLILLLISLSFSFLFLLTLIFSNLFFEMVSIIIALILFIFGLFVLIYEQKLSIYKTKKYIEYNKSIFYFSDIKQIDFFIICQKLKSDIHQLVIGSNIVIVKKDNSKKSIFTFFTENPMFTSNIYYINQRKEIMEYIENHTNIKINRYRNTCGKIIELDKNLKPLSKK